jgi:hypothetical protein
MNRLYLNKLTEICYTNYNNFKNNKNINKDIPNLIDTIKKNLLLNENVIFNKYNYINISNVFNEDYNNQIILIFPVVFIHNYNNILINVINSILLMYNNDYINLSNYLKKQYIEDFINKNNIQYISLNNLIFKLTSCFELNIIIINENVNIYKLINNKTIVIVNINDEYYPLENYNNCVYETNSNFINYLLTLSNVIYHKNEQILIAYEEEKYNTINNNLYVSDVKQQTKNNDMIGNNILNITSILTKKSHEKNKIKSNKNIFIMENLNNIKKNNITNDLNDGNINDDNNNNDDNINSIFVKTEKLSIEKVNEIKNTINKNTCLPELQKYALLLNINIISGSTKTGKPKNKTKIELYENIKNFVL